MLQSGFSPFPTEFALKSLLARSALECGSLLPLFHLELARSAAYTGGNDNRCASLGYETQVTAAYCRWPWSAATPQAPLPPWHMCAPNKSDETPRRPAQAGVDLELRRRNELARPTPRAGRGRLQRVRIPVPLPPLRTSYGGMTSDEFRTEI